MVSQGPALAIVACTFIGLTTIAVLLRFYTRLFIIRRFAVDDYLVLFAQVNFLAFMFCIIEETKHGIGKHLVDIILTNPADLVKGMRWWFIGLFFYAAGTCTVKVAIAIFFVALGPSRVLRIVAIVVAVVSVINCIAIIVFQATSCRPASFFWTRLEYGSKGWCLSDNAAFLWLSLFNAIDLVTDIILAILPTIMVWNMNIRKSMKFGISLLLGLGAMSAISPLIRAFYFKNVTTHVADFTYSSWPITITSVTEPGIAIVVVCITHLEPLIRKIIPKGWFGTDEPSRPKNAPPIFDQSSGKPKTKASYDELILLE